MRGFSDHKASALVLIAANMLPLLGVVFLGWDAFAIIVLYWIENVVIGAINVLKMIACNPQAGEVDLSGLEGDEGERLRKAIEEFGGDTEKAKLLHHGAKLFVVPFFVFHYGMFCFVHGIFVLVLFGHQDFDMTPLGEVRGFADVVSRDHLWWAVAGLAGSHFYSYLWNFLWQGEYRRVFVMQLMVQPYSRVAVLHVAIIFGAWVAMALGSNVGVLAALIVGKTVLDLKLHLREHEKNEQMDPNAARKMLAEVDAQSAKSEQRPATS